MVRIMGKMMYYDTANNRIVYLGEASSEAWDQHWKARKNIDYGIPKMIPLRVGIIRLFHKYIPRGSRILEGGCGLGQYVHQLTKSGYTVTGIDYAKETVEFAQRRHPELDIRLGDVTDLEQINDGEYDAYYSGGVIEHFYYGYNHILKEITRVIKPGGHLIITFPFMSRRRRQLAKTLPALSTEFDSQNFYQFALDENLVIQDIQEFGFDLLYKNQRNGTLGYFECNPRSLVIKWLQDHSGKSILVRCLRFGVSKVLSLLGYSHTIELVFRKKC
jgi:2-polyprenyl-3-methyl-5-hydroxy-6-metoxy-1,4-benzoquinol methylase